MIVSAFDYELLFVSSLSFYLRTTLAVHSDFFVFARKLCGIQLNLLALAL